MKRVTVAPATSVLEGKVFAVNIDGKAVLLTRTQGKVTAFSNKCPHVGLPLARGKLQSGVIQCPFHGSRFDVRNGENLDWACALGGLAMPKWSHALLSFGKKPAPLKMYDAVEENGSVVVSIPDA
ncbi:MAG: Rieske (2Fe-2S) protein [Steroidobacteraceae bacterium]